MRRVCVAEHTQRQKGPRVSTTLANSARQVEELGIVTYIVELHGCGECYRRPGVAELATFAFADEALARWAAYSHSDQK